MGDPLLRDQRLQRLGRLIFSVLPILSSGLLLIAIILYFIWNQDYHSYRLLNYPWTVVLFIIYGIAVFGTIIVDFIRSAKNKLSDTQYQLSPRKGLLFASMFFIFTLVTLSLYIVLVPIEGYKPILDHFWVSLFLGASLGCFSIYFLIHGVRILVQNLKIHKVEKTHLNIETEEKIRNLLFQSCRRVVMVQKN